MNSFESSSANPVDQAVIDRLVAGELPDPERRELLFKLEADPDGWRRCALAFLEDQAWRAALSGMSPEVQKPLPVVKTEPIPRTRWVRKFALAASIVALAFSVGFAAGGMKRETPQVEVVQQDQPRLPEPSKPITTDQVREVGWVDLVDGTSGELPPRRVPIVSGPGLDEQWLRDQPPAVSDYVRARWERQGYQVQERRNLVSVTLEDGRRISIPVDEVSVDYVGQTPL
jgi:hypothetical protein